MILESKGHFVLFLMGSGFEVLKIAALLLRNLWTDHLCDLNLNDFEHY